MFYCKGCAKKHGYPPSLCTSFGRCECCGKERECYDRAASTLPMPSGRRGSTKPLVRKKGKR